MESLMEKVNINGVQVKDMLVNFIRGSNMVKENGKVQDKQPVVMCMKENICMIKNMEKVFLHGQVETSTKANTPTMKGTEMGKCSGQMEACTKENGVEVFSMELVE